MPGPDPGASFWFRVGRILPRGIRERVFEPAYYDLVANLLTKTDGAQSGRMPPRFGLLVVWTTLECVGLGVSGIFVHKGKPTRTTWFLLGLFSLAILLLISRAGYET